MSNNLLWKMLEGTVINDQYKLNQLLGAGGYGGVFLADDVIDNTLIRQIAIKLLIPDTNNKQQLNEIIATTNLKHPHLISCLHGGKSNINGKDFLFLLMELADCSLEDQLTNGLLSEEETTVLIKNIAESLVYLHNQSEPIVHRDLKPGNILKVEDRWKLSDFGLVKIVSSGSLINTSHLFGTPLYVPPESYDGEISIFWDIWSLGVILVEVLTGKLPFRGDTAQQLQKQVCQYEPDLSDIPDKFEPIIRGCLQKDRKCRWRAEQILASLQGDNINLTVTNNIESETQNRVEFDKCEEVSLLYSLDIYDERLYTDNNLSISKVIITPDVLKFIHNLTGEITIHQLSNGRVLRKIKYNEYITSLALSSNGENIVSGDENGNIRILEFNTGKEINVFNGHSSCIMSLIVTPDQKQALLN